MRPIHYILFASNNSGKFREVLHVCKSFGIRALSPADVLKEEVRNEVGMALQGDVPNVAEDASSYHGNARLKADAFYDWGGIPSLADDTGLEVDALAGRPGIHSARYAGAKHKPEDNIRKLLKELSESPMVAKKGRRARFVCHLVLKLGEDKYAENHGELVGEIGFAPKGHGGFGYDSIFVVDGYNQTLAELKDKQINVKTHRILALEKLLAGLVQKHEG